MLEQNRKLTNSIIKYSLYINLKKIKCANLKWLLFEFLYGRKPPLARYINSIVKKITCQSRKVMFTYSVINKLYLKSLRFLQKQD